MRGGVSVGPSSGCLSGWLAGGARERRAAAPEASKEVRSSAGRGVAAETVQLYHSSTTLAGIAAQIGAELYR